MRPALRRVLLVEDERPIVEILTYHLNKEGFEVTAAHGGPEALDAFQRAEPDIVVLDLMLPGLDGLAVCREIRKVSAVPILMLTAKGEEVDKVVGLEVGADDYVTKPFSIREVVARVRALLRRSRPLPESGDRIAAGELLLDARAYALTKRGRPVDLTHREFQLLKLLMVRPKEVFTRDAILGEVWGRDFQGDARTVDVTVRRVREKIEDDPAHPQHLRTRRGVGYYFDPGGPA